MEKMLMVVAGLAVLLWIFGQGRQKQREKKLAINQQRQVEKIRYETALLQKSYIRFVPKQIETLLKKQSILEVNPGDSGRVKATMALLPMEPYIQYGLEDFWKQCAKEFEVLESVLNKNAGSILIGKENLTMAKLLLSRSGEEAVTLAVDVLHLWREVSRQSEQRAFSGMILLHEDTYLYGITGIREQAFPVVMSQETDGLEAYLDRLCKLGLCLVVTESVTRQIRAQERFRDIGYVALPGLQKKIRLYESLDAYNEKIRQERLQTGNAFQKALAHYYQRDFYLARDGFSKVIKMSASDQVAKLYLFHCEKRLEEAEQTAYDLALFPA